MKEFDDNGLGWWLSDRLGSKRSSAAQQIKNACFSLDKKGSGGWGEGLRPGRGSGDKAIKKWKKLVKPMIPEYIYLFN